jgi:hypothetical protein
MRGRPDGANPRERSIRAEGPQWGQLQASEACLAIGSLAADSSHSQNRDRAAISLCPNPPAAIITGIEVTTGFARMPRSRLTRGENGRRSRSMVSRSSSTMIGLFVFSQIGRSDFEAQTERR